MLSPTTSLLVGPYDWDAAIIPRAETEARLAALRAAMQAHGAGALLLHGNSQEHGALAWATGFTPKLGPALCLIQPEGAPKLLFSGGPGMRQSAALQTWVEDVQALGEPTRELRALLAGLVGKLAIGGLPTLAAWLHDAVTDAAGAPPDTADSWIDALRRHKSPLEQALITRSSEILRLAVARLRAGHAAGVGLRSAALAAEQVAYEEGAQDVRVLASRRLGGPPLALDDAPDVALPRALAWLAVRRAGYWAHAHLTLGPSAALPAARSALQRAIAAGGPGELFGVSLAEGPAATRQPDDALALRATAAQDGETASLSALLVAGTCLWSGEDA
jgi:hypothetical protein